MVYFYLFIFCLGLYGYVPVTDSRDPHLQNMKPNGDVDVMKLQPGGAYIMRSSEKHEVPTRVAGNSPVSLSISRGKIVKEVHQKFSDYASQIVRLREGSAEVELGSLFSFRCCCCFYSSFFLSFFLSIPKQY